MSKVNSFLRETIARFKGDTDKVLAEKNYRTVLNGIKTQVSLLEGEQFKKEELVSQAEEDLKTAKFPTERVTDTERYFEKINSAKSRLEEAKEAVSKIKESITEYKALEAEFSAEVEAPKEEEKK